MARPTPRRIALSVALVIAAIVAWLVVPESPLPTEPDLKAPLARVLLVVAALGASIGAPVGRAWFTCAIALVVTLVWLFVASLGWWRP